MKEILNSAKAPAPIGPYSQAVRFENTLYISGQIPIDETKGILVQDSIESETEQVMKNIGYILEAAGCNYSDILKCSIFIKNMGDFGKINAVYGNYFPSNPPARETVQVSELPKGANVEISCIVGIPN
jgi:2-iminobutanoate/2-iminopropanoate deaminase